jgi:protein-S-isoprenylcysteine O-methyltransferase Ste14
MTIAPLNIAAYCAYLAAWMAFAVASGIQAMRARRIQTPASPPVSMPIVIGIALQVASALPITLALPEGPLRPRTFELVAVLILAPLGAGLFIWATLSAKAHIGERLLVIDGAYRWLRHPIYLAFLSLLLATGLLASAGLRLAAGLALYVAGTELRIAVEEAELTEKFAEYTDYRSKTRWRYLPGLR